MKMVFRKCPFNFSNRWLSVIFLLSLITFALLYYQCYYYSIPSKSSKIGNNQNRRQLSQSPDNDVNDDIKKLQTFLFVAILTSPKGFLRRRAIRETWLKFGTKRETQHKFIIGVEGLNQALINDLNTEQLNNGDLLFLHDHQDSYRTLTKKLLKTLLWIEHHISCEFVMKADDDTFVRLGLLLPELKKHSKTKRIYWGFFRGNSNVKRVGPWAEKQWYLSDHYLPYAMGGGYLLSSDLVKYISKVSQYLQHYNSEDVSLGVWLAPVKLNYIHDIRFDTEYKSKGCNNKHIVSHKQEPEHMYEKYDHLQHYNKLCKMETETMQTFDYNWDLPPSKCCKRVPISTIKRF